MQPAQTRKILVFVLGKYYVLLIPIFGKYLTREMSPLYHRSFNNVSMTLDASYLEFEFENDRKANDRLVIRRFIRTQS